MAKKPIKATGRTEAASPPPAAAAAANLESKKTRLIAMLRQPDSSTIAAISAALGWQAHTTRAARHAASPAPPPCSH